MLRTRSRRLMIAFILALFLMLLFIAMGWVQGTAADDELPPRPEEPTPTVTPPAPTVTPAPAPSVPSAPADPINGASIQLKTSASMPGAWTAVEWQNEQGYWYEVEGWRGHLDEGSADTKTWWVYSNNFGEGPFRWVIYTAENGDKVVTSDTFNLPTAVRQIVAIEVDIPTNALSIQ